MRLTSILCKRKQVCYIHRFKMLWRENAAYREPELKLPQFINDHGIQVINPNELVKPPLRFPRWEPPIKDDIRFAPPKTEKDNPDYHDEAVYEFNPDIHLIEGEKQALLLTRSQPFYQLPSSITDFVGAVQIPDQDLLMQRIIMQSNVWDPTKDKLPKRPTDHLLWKFKAECGIPNLRIASLTIRNILRLCQLTHGWHPDLAATRRVALEPYMSMFYYFQGDKHVMIHGDYEALVSSTRPLPQFASDEVIDQSVGHSIPDIFPLAPTIDLKRQHIWRHENVTGWRPGASHTYPHMLFLKYDSYDKWTTSQHNAKSLLYCYGHAVALAKDKYGWEAQTLNAPICVQSVLTDGVMFHLTCFQLNTLSTRAGDGVKNLVWFDSDNAICNKIVPKRAMLRNTRYEDYDPSVLQRLLAMYVRGATLNTGQTVHVAKTESGVSMA